MRMLRNLLSFLPLISPVRGWVQPGRPFGQARSLVLLPEGEVAGSTGSRLCCAVLPGQVDTTQEGCLKPDCDQDPARPPG